MTVPEAAVHKDRLLSFFENDIRRSRKALPVKPVTIAHPVKGASDYQFRRRIALSHCFHHAASLLGADRVHRASYVLGVTFDKPLHIREKAVSLGYGVARREIESERRHAFRSYRCA